MKVPKVALVHDYLIQYGGAEKTLEAISEIYPEAPIYTSIYRPENFPNNLGGFSSRKIVTAKGKESFLKILPIFSKYFTFLIPLIFEDFDLSEYDLIISDSSSYAKGVLTKQDQLHISYLHTPPRFLYGYSVENTKRNAWFYKPVVAAVDTYLRLWDFNAAQRPDYLLANSEEIKERIKKFYQREATVIYPPVELAKEKPAQQKELLKNPYYLVTGRLVAYKNFDLIIKAFRKLPQLTLYVIGEGLERKHLQSLAGNNVKFFGKVDENEKHRLMRNCLGLINSVKDEDFGIVPIEVISHGRPVLVHRSAGHLETVREGINGLFFEQLDEDALVLAIKNFDQEIRKGSFDPEVVRKSVQMFSKDNFKKNFSQFVEQKLQGHFG